MNDYKIDEVHITKEQLNSLKDKFIGQGKDGKVYNIGNGLLYKIYYGNSFNDIDKILEDDVKIYDRKKNRADFKNSVGHFEYVDCDGVKLRSSTAIKKAALRQVNVSNTALPIAPIFVGDHFKGCVLRNHSHHFPIHEYMLFLPKNLQIKILKQVLINVKELFNNNIYPVDLANNGLSEYAEDNSHSNILVSPLGKVQIIDLDGRSTIYRERPDKRYENLSLRSLNVLVLETLLNIDLLSFETNYDSDYLVRKMTKSGLPKDIVEAMLMGDCNIENIDEFLNIYKKTKSLHL